MFFDRFGSDNWKIRRRLVILTIAYCAGYVLYLGVWGGDTELSRSIANGLILLAGSTLGSYVFGVTWDDKNKSPSTTTEIKQTTVTQPAPVDPQPPPGMAEN